MGKIRQTVSRIKTTQRKNGPSLASILFVFGLTLCFIFFASVAFQTGKLHHKQSFQICHRQSMQRPSLQTSM